MKKTILIASILLLSGCSTISKFWPRDHDPVMFNQLVSLDINIDKQDCLKPNWVAIKQDAEQLARYTELRNDPQSTNIRKLQQHIVKLSESKNEVFCKLGKDVAKQRINAVSTAWKGR